MIPTHIASLSNSIFSFVRGHKKALNGKEKLIPVDGNTAAANVAYQMSEAAFIYPITPSTPMGELYDFWVSKKRKNVWDEIPVVKVLQSEGGASGALHGAAAVGTFTTTFTASQGLLLMIPNMLKISGELWPAVFHVAARSVSTQALSIQGDHSDIMLSKNTGFAFLSSSSVQECQDLACVAHSSSVNAEIPFVHFFEGFRLSNQIDSIVPLPFETMKEMMPFEKLEQIRLRSLNPSHPIILGHGQGTDGFFQTTELGNSYYSNIPSIVEKEMNKFSQLTGRTYHLFDYFGHPNATDVIVVMGAAAPTVIETLKLLKNDKVGLIIPRLYRPWSREAFLKVLPKSVQRISVLDRSKDPAAPAEPLLMDVAFTLKQASHPATVIGGRYGLASRDFTPAHAKAVFNNMKSSNPKRTFTIGIQDDVYNLSLPLPPNEKFDLDSTKILYWGLGGDGTVGANKAAIKAAIEQAGLYGQAFFAYSADKSNSLTRSFLRFSEEPIVSQYLLAEADFIGCTLPEYVLKYPLIDRLKDGGTFWLNFPTSDIKHLEKRLPANLRRQLAQKKVKFYIIDATKIAEDCGMPGKISPVIQSSFFQITGILGSDHVKVTSKWIDSEFGRYGPTVVEKNKKAASMANDRLKLIEIPDSWLQAVDEPSQFPSRTEISFIPESTHPISEYVKDVLKPATITNGGKLPVSKFKYNLGGVSPVGTSKWLKKGLSSKIPIWNKSTCVQCNLCSAVCSHSVIRPVLFSKDEIEKLPYQLKDSFGSIPARDPQLKDLEYRIQISPYDCIGCELCRVNCPTQSLSMGEIVSEKGVQLARNQNDLFIYIDDFIPDRGSLLKDKFTVRNSQFQRPLLEFPGSCAGCTETSVTKILTQLFGERMTIANASGCSSVWGGAWPIIPFTTNKNGRGPAWARSLFEDNGEFGYGHAVGLSLRRTHLKSAVQKLLDTKQIKSETRDLLTKWVQNFDSGPETLNLLQPILSAVKSESSLSSISKVDDLWVKPSNWTLGGDGWAYDIGFGGLDHVLASNVDFNVLVFDNEIYSNTGGQQSKATQLGAVAQFASSGKDTFKKDLGFMMMNYGNVYVASVSMENSKSIAHLIKCLKEAESYQGPSLVICYCNCALHHIQNSIGAGGSGGSLAGNLALESGYWLQYSYDPRKVSQGKNPLEIFSKAPQVDKLDSFLNMEVRYRDLKRVNPDESSKMNQELKEYIGQRYQKYLAFRSIYSK